MATLSVVIPSVNGWTDLEGCLVAVEQQRNEADLDVIVVDRCGSDVRQRVSDRFPEVRVLGTERHVPIPHLRALAFQEARGESVAVIEDHVIVPPGWARQLLEAQANGEEVVGGAVVNAATERLVDWAAFLCEYSQILPPLPSGPVPGLPGNNTVYRRALLERYQAVIAEGRWENYLHDAMRRDGIPLISRPEIQVGHKRHYTVWQYVKERFWYSRAYAGLQTENASAVRRLLAGAKALLLPPVLFVRIVSTVWRKGGHRKELLRSLPLLALFATVWGLGEVVGHWAGRGDALAKVC